MTEEIEYPTSGRFEQMLYFMITVWVWYWHGKNWSIKITLEKKAS